MNPMTVMDDAVPGMGIDADMERRPGVPMEDAPPRPIGYAHWAEPERQEDPGYVLKRADLAELTPVFGTAIPPRGLSGLLRRAAYRIPEHFTSHWLTLMAADRIDALEHRAKKVLPFVIPLGILAVAVPLLAARTRRRRWLPAF